VLANVRDKSKKRKS